MDPNSGYSGGDRTDGGRAFAPPRGYALSGKIMLSAVVVLFTVVLLVFFLHLYVRWHLVRRATRRRLRRRARFVFADETQRPAASAGLDPEAIKSLPVVVCSADACSAEGDVVAECAVCLNEFDEGEKVRKLPRCGHRFHIECIDMWFYSHATCPLCRSPVEPANNLPAAAVGILVAEPAMPSDLCSSNPTVDIVGSSSSVPGAADLRIDVPARRGFDDEVVLPTMSPGGFKSPGGRIRAIRRLLSRDRMLCRVGGHTEEQDLERGEAAERAHPPPHAPPPPPPPPPGVES